MRISRVRPVWNGCFLAARHVVEGLDARANAEESGREVENQQRNVLDLVVADRFHGGQLVLGANALPIVLDQQVGVGIVETTAIADPAGLCAGWWPFVFREDAIASAIRGALPAGVAGTELR